MNTHDEFFDVETPELLQTEQIAILQRVVPKREFLLYANTLNQCLLEQHSSLEAFVRIRNVIEILESASAQLKEKAIVDLQDSISEVFGARVQLKQLPRKFEYTDRIVDELEAEKKIIEERLKARKKYLETLPATKDESGNTVCPAKFISGGVTLQVSF